MIVLIRRVYLHDDSTMGCLRIYDGEERDGGRYLCDTLEPRAIPWRDYPDIGLRAGRVVAGRTAIPEGVYSLGLKHSRKFKQLLPALEGIEGFRTLFVRPGKDAASSGGDIMVCDSKAFAQLVRLIRSATKRGDKVTLVVRSTRNWRRESDG